MAIGYHIRHKKKIQMREPASRICKIPQDSFYQVHPFILAPTHVRLAGFHFWQS